MEQEKKRVFRIRDRRVPTEFSIHNHIIDQWFPIITTKGYTLYCLYCRMAGEEHSISNYAIARYTGMAANTMADYNKLLVWCGLIRIEPGTAPNTHNYAILETPTVNAERIALLKGVAAAELDRRIQAQQTEANRLQQIGLTAAAEKMRHTSGNKFIAALLNRLQKWQPLQVYGDHNQPQPPQAQPGQLLLFDHPADDPCHPTNGSDP